MNRVEVYRPGQARVLFKFLKRPPLWFLIGGQADGDEAQTVVEQYRECWCIGVEPVYYRNALPFPGTAIRGALTASPGHVTLFTPSGDSRRTTRDRHVTGAELTVPGYTIDSLVEQYKINGGLVIWLDIEGMELDALQGATESFTAGIVDAVNVEVELRTPTELAIRKFFRRHRLAPVDEWGAYGSLRNRVYVR